jgi:hypothetical protein
MASTYVNDLRLNEMATGDGSGTWGTTTNTNLELIAEAFSYGTEVITTNADTHTTTIADGATDPGRSLYLKYTGTLDSACTITIGPNTVSKVWIIENGTSGSQNIILSQGSGANITIPAGDTKVVYSDGAGAGAAFVDAFASLSVVDLKVQDDLTVTDAALVTGVLTTTATQVATGGITSGSDIISDTDSTDSLGSTGVRWLKGWFDTLTAGTLTVGSGSVTDSSGAISFGDENLTTTGIVTAAGTSVFTNLDISGDIDVDGTTNLDVVDIDGAVQIDATLSVGVNDTGYDVKLFGATSGKYMLWDESADLLIVSGAVESTTNFNSTSGNDLRLNAGSANRDIFMQVNGTTHMTVQGSTGGVGIGTDAPGSFDAEANNLVVGSGSGDEGITIFTGSSVGDYGSIFFGDATGTPKQGQIRYEQNNEVMSFYTNTSEKMRIDLDGHVGIGTSSPLTTLTIAETAGNTALTFQQTNNGTTNWLIGAQYTASNTFEITPSTTVGGSTFSTPALAINSSGNVLVNTTAVHDGAAEMLQVTTSGGGSAGYGINIKEAAAGGGTMLRFNTAGSIVGQIYTSGSATTYATSSDARLKDVTGEARGLEVISALNPVSYNWKIDGQADEGLIAQEVEEIVPNAIHISQADDDSNGMYSMDYSKLVVHLVKAIQEQQAFIEAQTTPLKI